MKVSEDIAMGSKKQKCVVDACKNTDSRLARWKENWCEVHCNRKHRDCRCLEPFRLLHFPRWSTTGQRLLRLLSRQEKQLNEEDCICSEHLSEATPEFRGLFVGSRRPQAELERFVAHYQGRTADASPATSVDSSDPDTTCKKRVSSGS